MTKRTWITAGLLAAVALPASASAHPPTKADRSNAAQECRTERGSTDATREAFAQKYGTEQSNYRNAFGKCVSSRAKDEHSERHAAKRSASRDCREEREAGPAAFRMKYGTARSNYRNAFGKCVSGKARKREAAADRADAREMKRERNAAQTCADERQSLGEQAFREKYGTSRSQGRNAFGKCVSQSAKAQS